MLYNLPVATGVNLDPDTVGQLAREVDNIRYIKDTSADMAQAGQLIHHYGDVISTFVGWDSLLLAALTEGAAGVMAGTANVMPAQLVSIHRALMAGDLDRARREWAQHLPAHGRDHVGPVHPRQSRPRSTLSGSRWEAPASHSLNSMPPPLRRSPNWQPNCRSSPHLRRRPSALRRQLRSLQQLAGDVRPPTARALPRATTRP